VPAFKLGERTADPLQMYLADVFTIPANLAGICGVSLPCGFAKSAGRTDSSRGEVDGVQPRTDRGSRTVSELPIGLQLLGKALDEGRIFQIAHAYEQSTDWHKARSPIALNPKSEIRSPK
jgi:aspartyl-tRNA(Asn)/glutamyl-tRNA(Gln) amidotransferase subunit A